MKSTVPPTLAHLPDADISLFQSAVAAATQRARAVSDPNLTQGSVPPVDHSSPMHLALAHAAETMSVAAPASAAASLRAGLAGAVAEDCAKRYLNRAIAEASGDLAKIAAAQEQLPRYGTCDGLWIEALSDFILHAALRRHSTFPIVSGPSSATSSSRSRPRPDARRPCPTMPGSPSSAIGAPARPGRKLF